MGYSDEIIYTPDLKVVDPIEIARSFETGNWMLGDVENYKILNSGSDSDWITLPKSIKGKEDFYKIIDLKKRLKEYIAFYICNRHTSEVVVLNCFENRLLFEMQKIKDLNKMQVFEETTFSLLDSLKGSDYKHGIVEWRSGYENLIIKSYRI